MLICDLCGRKVKSSTACGAYKYAEVMGVEEICDRCSAEFQTSYDTFTKQCWARRQEEQAIWLHNLKCELRGEVGM